MKYKNTIEGQFIDRPNRFISHVKINGIVENVHVKNTGRCKELLLPGANVILSISDNPTRKTKFDLISVFKNGLGWVNIDSQAPNVIVKEWLESDSYLFSNITLLKPECKYGNSRIDFYLECTNRKIFIEVKGCTLEIDKTGFFPDAPTERGIKHLNELSNAVQNGYECYIAFVIAMNGVSKVLPNRNTHPEFADALDEAVKSGVKILYLTCEVNTDEINIANCIIG